MVKREGTKSYNVLGEKNSSCGQSGFSEKEEEDRRSHSDCWGRGRQGERGSVTLRLLGGGGDVGEVTGYRFLNF